MAAFNSILVVCVGNICRSPTAEILLRKELNAAGKDIRVSSAGLAALVGHKMDNDAEASLKNHSGLCGSSHVAKQLCSQMLKDSDLIFAMENEHINAISKILPSARGKTFLLGNWQDNKEIPDPYRQSREAYEHVYMLIEDSIKEWIKHL